MGLRFRKKIKIIPGVSLNIGKKGTSLSIGRPGAAINLGSKGRVRTTLGIPGTGISYTTQSTPRKTQNNQQATDNNGCLFILFIALILFIPIIYFIGRP